MGPQGPFLLARTHREKRLYERVRHELGESLPEVDLLDVELDGPREHLRVFIDHPGGVTLERCGEVTHAIRDTCPELSLEVSSPGEERPLRRREHFDAAVGSRVRLRHEGGRKAAVVTVAGTDEDSVTFTDGAGDELRVPYGEIIRCRLAPPPAGQGAGTGTDRQRSTRKGRTR